MGTKNKITKATFDLLTKELNECEALVSVIISQIQAAREQGDLSENADYAESKNRQAENNHRISEIKAILLNCEIIDEKDLKTATIEIVSGNKKGETINYLFASEAEVSEGANFINQNNMRKVSINSPIAKAICGAQENSTIQITFVPVPYQIKIIKNNYKTSM